MPAILEFIDSGRNVLVAASSDVSDTIRTLAAEVGVDLDEKGSKVFDHFSHASLEGTADHTLLIAKDAVKSEAILGKEGGKVRATALSHKYPHKCV